MSICLRRRDFIVAFGDATAAWPLSARSQCLRLGISNDADTIEQILGRNQDTIYANRMPG